MAILSKIRERSIFLIVIIGLALFAFVLTGLFEPGSPLFNKNPSSIGEINDENISREEFAELVEQHRARTGNRSSQLQSVNAAWDNLVREKIYQTQLEKSGVIVGEKDVWDEVLKQPFVQNNPQFKNEAGLFDEERFKEYIANIIDAKEDGEQEKAMYLSWLEYERNVKSNLQIRMYNNLITAGLGVTLKEGEHHYFDNNTRLDVEYVYVPYASIADSLFTITDDEIKKYVKSNPDDYRTEASRNISFVKFDIKATPQDEEAIKNNLASLINDREEFNKAAKSNIDLVGFANTSNIEEFFRENSSDTPLDTKFYTKSKLNKEVADSIFNLELNEVYGPYKEGEFFKLSKLVEIKQLPDSVKSRHILIPFVGALRADPSITQTEEEAKKTADSLLSILKADKSKFESFVTTFSSDIGSVNNGGKYDWFNYDRMVPEFRDFTFENNVGDIDVVKTAFGFHIIEIEGQKNKQKAVKIATFSRKIEASEETENDIFEKAETFASELSNGKDITELAKETNLTVQPVIGLKAMDENVSTLANQRQIVTWTFDKSTKENEVKRFDIDKGYVVVLLTAKRKKGLSIGVSKSKIRTIVLNEKKAQYIKDKMDGENLQEIAQAFGKTVNSSKSVSLGSPALPEIGRSPETISILTSLNENKLYKNIEIRSGIFAAKISKKEIPQGLDNYTSSTNTVANSFKSKGAKAYDILKDFADIEDNRAIFY